MVLDLDFIINIFIIAQTDLPLLPLDSSSQSDILWLHNI